MGTNSLMSNQDPEKTFSCLVLKNGPARPWDMNMEEQESAHGYSPTELPHQRKNFIFTSE